MAVSNAKRMVCNTQVTAYQIIEPEQSGIKRERFQTAVESEGSLTGKSVVNITAAQESAESVHSWCTRKGRNFNFDKTDEVWNSVSIEWNGSKLFDQTGAFMFTGNSDAVLFLYLKNVSSSEKAYVSLNGTSISAAYPIIIQPGGAIYLRGDGTGLTKGKIKIKAETSKVYIEYIVAK